MRSTLKPTKRDENRLRPPRTDAPHPVGKPRAHRPRYEGIHPGERIEIADTDETLSVVTKVLKVERRAAGLFRIEIADPATAFSADGNNANL